jgi:hypothetical protein
MLCYWTQGATDPGSHLIDSPDRQGQHFLALGPALRILQLNVEGLLAAKRELISDIVVRQKADVVCLQASPSLKEVYRHYMKLMKPLLNG